MNNLQRHQFSALCEALHRKEREAVDNFKEEAGQPMSRSDTTSTQEPTVPVRRSTARVALRFAEQAADEINAKLRDAEIERDELARKLGAQQDMIDRLQSEREYRSRHVRDLMVVSETGS